MKTWRLLDTGALPASLNMALDRALLAHHAQGQSPPTLRFYRWNPPAVSLGYFQNHPNLDLAACRRLGFEVVRRPTGGRAVLHLGDLTYALIAGTADGLPAAVTAAYRLTCAGLLEGFRLLGLEARIGRGGRNPAQTGICWLDGVVGSVVYQEKKFVGSAQTWQASSLLQHGSVMLAPQIKALVSLWGGRAGSGAELRARLDTQITSLQEILGRLPEPEEVTAALQQGLARVMRVGFAPGELTPGEWALAREIAGREVEKSPCPSRTSPRYP